MTDECECPKCARYTEPTAEDFERLADKVERYGSALVDEEETGGSNG